MERNGQDRRRTAIVVTPGAAASARLLDALAGLGYDVSIRPALDEAAVAAGAIVCVVLPRDGLAGDFEAVLAAGGTTGQPVSLLLLDDGGAVADSPDEGFRREVRALAHGLAPRARVNAIVLEEGAAGLEQALDLLLQSPAITGQTLRLGGDPRVRTRPTLEGMAPPGMPPHAGARGVRRMFIRDLVVAAFIGVHRHEKAGRQRIRLNVDLDVLEEGVADDRLAEVVCYETMAERIRAVSRTGHVNLVETLAERVAEICLADRRVLVARVRIEKLDIFADAASAGVEIERRQSVP